LWSILGVLFSIFSFWWNFPSSYKCSSFWLIIKSLKVWIGWRLEKKLQTSKFVKEKIISKKNPKDADLKKNPFLKSKVMVNVKVKIFKFTKWETFQIPMSIATKCDKKSKNKNESSKNLRFHFIYIKNTRCIINDSLFFLIKLIYYSNHTHHSSAWKIKKG